MILRRPPCPCRIQSLLALVAGVWNTPFRNKLSSWLVWIRYYYMADIRVCCVQSCQRRRANSMIICGDLRLWQSMDRSSCSNSKCHNPWGDSVQNKRRCLTVSEVFVTNEQLVGVLDMSDSVHSSKAVLMSSAVEMRLLFLHRFQRRCMIRLIQTQIWTDSCGS